MGNRGLRNKGLWVIGAIVIFMLVRVVFSIVMWAKFIDTPIVPAGAPLYFELNNNDTPLSLGKYLKNKHLLDKPQYIVWLSVWDGVDKHLQVGEYEFMPGTTPRQMLQQIATGKVIQYRVAIIDGWTFKDMMTTINNAPKLKHTLMGLNNEAIMAKLGHPNVPRKDYFSRTPINILEEIQISLFFSVRMMRCNPIYSLHGKTEFKTYHLKHPMMH